MADFKGWTWCSLLALFLFLCWGQAHGGIYGAFCPPGADNKFHESCNNDCQVNHKALYGWCGVRPGDYNCYCSPTLNYVLKSAVGHSTDCLDPNLAGYDEDCRLSCQCFHNAPSGYCDYPSKACICVGQYQNPVQNNECPFKTPEDYDAYRKGLQIP